MIPSIPQGRKVNWPRQDRGTRRSCWCCWRSRPTPGGPPSPSPSREELVEVHERRESGEQLGVGRGEGARDRREVAAVVGRLVRLEIERGQQRRIEVAERPLVEVARYVGVVAAEEILVDSLHVNVEPEVRVVDDDVSEVAARRRDARAGERRVPQALANEGRVLPRVVEGHRVHARDPLALDGVIEAELERRLVGQSEPMNPFFFTPTLGSVFYPSTTPSPRST